MKEAGRGGCAPSARRRPRASLGSWSSRSRSAPGRRASPPRSGVVERLLPVPPCVTSSAPVVPSGAGQQRRRGRRGPGGAAAAHEPGCVAQAARARRERDPTTAALIATRRVAGPDDELGAAHAEHRRGRPHLHRVGRLLGDLARHGGERALQRGLERALVGRGVEGEAVDGEAAVGPDREQAVVGEGDADGAIGSGDHDVAFADPACRRARAVAAPRARSRRSPWRS